MKNNHKLRFSIDRGGTFTDIYAEVPGETGYRVVKLLSEDPDNYSDAALEGIRRIIEDVTGTVLAPGALDAGFVEWVRMGTTLATNALLERKGAPCVLAVTRGFKDILAIGNQDRPDIFDLEIRKPELLYEDVIEIDERIRLLKNGETPETGRTMVTGITGDRFEIRNAPDPVGLKKQLAAVREKGIDSIAVVLMHAWAWPEHEKQVGELAKQVGFSQVSLSSRVTPMVKLVPRGDTAMVDAYLTPIIQAYRNSFRKGFNAARQLSNIWFMQSDGGLVRDEGFTGSRAIFSGPAGGVVGYAMTTFNRETKSPVIGFDMGGTSTDVSRYGGEYEIVMGTETAGVRIQAPQLHIQTVAAGGGSRLFFESGMFRVGPESSGAHPGPVCYRKKGHLSLTDANLVLGRIQPDYFPCIFGVSKDRPLDLDIARKALGSLSEEINAFYQKKGNRSMSVEQVALGYVNVANEVMVRPIREISVMRGFDVQEHVLATFGGAGGQHACAIARSLGIKRIFIHRFSGILSAYGMGLADVVVEKQAPSGHKYRKSDLPAVVNALQALAQDAEKDLMGQGVETDTIITTAYLNLRYSGTDTAMMIAAPPDGDYGRAFRTAYLREFGFELKDRQLLIDDFRVRSCGGSGEFKKIPLARATKNAAPMVTRPVYFNNGWRDTPIYRLAQLKADHVIPGPAMIINDTSTILIEPDCTGSITRFGDVVIDVTPEKQALWKTVVDPIQLSIFSNLFMSIAEQMGRTLQKTAISTNIKERLDFSCALFGPDGELVANAPHLPVHLGAMSEAVKAQIRINRDYLHPGDVLLSNHPAAGGSHLPDMTVITPVFMDGCIIFWVASRGHHADIGGITPGSMPPGSHTLDEEGACITSFKLVGNGSFQEKGLIALLQAPAKKKPAAGRPAISGSRRIPDNLSDLRAQVAANQKGIDLVLEMVEKYGLKMVQAYMGHIQNAAAQAVRDLLRRLSADKGLNAMDTVRAVDYMDDGSPIVLNLTIDRHQGSAVFDFGGTGCEVLGNWNTPRAVTKSAILYALRCLIEKDLPLNNGCLIPIDIRIPEGCLLAPSVEAAVVGGNVLTSQRIVDVIFKAFGAAAASQGCMNNFTFGNARFGYYETIGGGAGAGPGWHGESGVHTHMTNTRITDPEILERDYPVLLRRFSIRSQSGGAGAYHGGNGMVREVEFLEPMTAAILSERRVHPPYGLNGGRAGSCGKNLLIRKNGKKINMGGKCEVHVEKGDSIRILTPGGGGYGMRK